MISSRYAFPALVLLVLASIPTVIHTYVGAKSDSGESVTLIPEVLNGWTSRPYNRHNAEWVNGMFRSSDWFERIYMIPGQADVRLFVARSFDHKRLYHHPELGLSHGSNLGSASLVTLPEEAEIPVYLYKQENGNEFVGYVLLYEGDYIDSPITHQIRNALGQLISARKPMTLFYVSGSFAESEKEFQQTPAASILAAAIRDYRG
jgi:hypothetical protein